MPGPGIKILISLAAVSIVYAFVCRIRMTQKASRLARWLQKERPELWSELNIIARNWQGGLPGLKLLARRNVIDLPGFDREFEQLHTIERKFLRGIWTGALCIGALLAGFILSDWHW